MSSKKLIGALVLNIIIVILEIIGFTISIQHIEGIGLNYFTQESNLFALIVCLIFIVLIIKNLKNKTNVFPKWIKVSRSIVVVSLTTTLLVSFFILSRMITEMGLFNIMFTSSMLYHHTLCPLLMLISFLFFEEINFNKKIYYLIGIAHVLVYGVITMFLNIIHVMDGPYPFLKVYDQSIYMSIIWFIAIIGGSYLISYIINVLNRKINKKE